MEELRDKIYDLDSLIDWLGANVAEGTVLSVTKGITIEMLLDRLDEVADREWSDSIDAMGEDA